MFIYIMNFNNYGIQFITPFENKNINFFVIRYDTNLGILNP